MVNNKSDKVLLAHGGGGQLTANLIHDLILPTFDNEVLARLSDSAVLDVSEKRICFTTDSYVVKPLFFNGGDIGKLSVCGTINDLAVQGAEPLALSLGLIIETGFEMSKLEKILKSIATTARENNVMVVTGDTKTVEAGSADGIFINTAGIGTLADSRSLSLDRVKPGDKIIVSGSMGDHGMTVISQRKGIEFESDLKSDCAALIGLTREMLMLGDSVKFMRDPTRGGLSVLLNDISSGTGCDIKITEKDIPVKANVQAAADMLGFDVLTIANEGKLVAVVDSADAEKCLAICKKHPLGGDAAIIGTVGEPNSQAIVEMVTEIGGSRIVQVPYGRELPRIC
jgi:hydrogenase expression/formation protein HypE